MADPNCDHSPVAIAALAMVDQNLANLGRPSVGPQSIKEPSDHTTGEKSKTKITPSPRLPTL